MEKYNIFFIICKRIENYKLMISNISIIKQRLSFMHVMIKIAEKLRNLRYE